MLTPYYFLNEVSYKMEVSLFYFRDGRRNSCHQVFAPGYLINRKEYESWWHGTFAIYEAIFYEL